MDMRRLLLLLVILVLAVPAMAQEQSIRGRQWQILMQPRYTGTKTVEADGGSELKIRDDLGWGFGFAYNFNRRFALGAGFSWRSANCTARLVDANDPNLIEDRASEFQMGTAAVNGVWYALESALTPFVSLSFGWMFLESNMQTGTNSGCWWVPWLGYACGSYPTTYGTDTYSGSVGGGVRWEPSKTGEFFMQAGYEFGYTGEDAIGNANIWTLGFGLLM